MSKQTCADYFETWVSSSDGQQTMSEQYWSGGIDTTAVFNIMLRDSKKEGVDISDADTWEYDEPIYRAYKDDSDKALS